MEDRGRTVSIANVGSLSGKVKVKGGQKKKWSDITLDVRDGMMYLYEDENQLRKKTPFDTIALAGHQVAEISKVHLGFVVFKDSKKDGLLFTAGKAIFKLTFLVQQQQHNSNNNNHNTTTTTTTTTPPPPPLTLNPYPFPRQLRGSEAMASPYP